MRGWGFHPLLALFCGVEIELFSWGGTSGVTTRGESAEEGTENSGQLAYLPRMRIDRAAAHPSMIYVIERIEITP
jgi:hypothetical protein